MIRQPLIPRSSFWADTINLLTLRRLYREPAKLFPCDRCGLLGAKVQLVVCGFSFSPHSNIRLCPACQIDFHWFMMTPPEQPNSSSDSVVGETEVPNG